jgi:transcriptional regulator with XRE-family HTH domain
MTPTDLIAWLNSLSLSPRQGAEALGVSRQAMYRYLNGEHPIPKPVAKLARMLEKENGK